MGGTPAWELDKALSPRWEGRGAYSALVGEPVGRRKLEKPKSRWQDNVKMKAGWGSGLDRSGSG